MTDTSPNDLLGAIAIVGLAGRFPKARNLEEFWQNLKDGLETVSFFDEEELLAAGVPEEVLRDPHYVPARAILEDADLFDAEFFGISPREAESIDPQQRLFLECAWEALEHAGYDSERYEGAIAVFAGLSMNTYLHANLLQNPAALQAIGAYQVMIGNDKDFLATRASYKLNLKGPSLTVQTACSTSLVAVQMACQSLLAYQCDAALAGGVSVSLPQKSGYLYQPGMIMSPDGHCRAFDSQARGIVGGEGVGVIVLKRYEDAQKDGDTIHAIIRGAAINNDGGLKVGYTAPSVDGQTEAILMAQAVGGVAPGSITYIEAHGTGTELGDPIEISALTQAFRAGTQENGFCAIGSVKTNMGHLDAAAGIAGLIKTVLALKHKQIPPSLHYQTPNPQIDFENSPFYVNAALKPWVTDRLPRRAGVSSFGIGGTNAHAVLEEAEQPPAGQSAHREHLLIVSARSENALKTAARNLAEWLKHNPRQLADAAYTLQVGRRAFHQRGMLVCTTAEEAVRALETLDPQHVFRGTPFSANPPVVFLFPGQGAQYANMGRDLYQNEAVFRQSVDRCAALLQPHLGLDLRDVLYPAEANIAQAEEQLAQTWLTQPALFTIEYATAQLWQHLGIQPQALVGHSIGEYVAACLAGVFSLEDAVMLVAARGKLMQSQPGGAMLSVPMHEQELLPLLDGEVQLAVINGPKMAVVSGPHPAIERLQAALTARGVASRKLRTSHAFHSAMMDPILEDFRALCRRVPMHPPRIRCLSNLTGSWLTDQQAVEPDYWAAHLRSTVRFSQNLEVLFQQNALLLEVGPGQSLSTLARQHAQKPARQPIYASLRHPQEAVSDTLWITRTLGQLWLEGVTPDWPAYQAGGALHRIALPTYPFERKRFMVAPQPGAALEHAPQKPAKRADMASWFYTPSWQRAAPLARSAKWKPGQRWLLLCDAAGSGSAIAQALVAHGQQVVSVFAGEGFAQIDPHSFRLRLDHEADYSQLVRALRETNQQPDRILHLWSAAQPAATALDTLDEQQTRGFYSLVFLAKALGDHAAGWPIEINVITRHLYDVTGTERLEPAQALVLGPCMTIPLEYPQLRCRLIDVDHLDNGVLEPLLAELVMPAGDGVIALRGPHRWQPALLSTPLPIDAEAKASLRSQGVYLITGGYGGVGLALAGFLAHEVQARLVLVGRSGVPDRERWPQYLDQHALDDRISKKIRALQQMEAHGAQLLLEKVDCTDPRQMQAVIARAKATFGALHGVIHAAGTAGGGIIQRKTLQQAQQVLDPKLRGTWLLGELLKDEPLDFLVLCSSVNALVGAGGQVDYAAANAYQDAYAAAARVAYPVQSINWTAWQEVGMAAETEVPAAMRRERDERLKLGVHPSEGYLALKRVLASRLPRVIVSPVDITLYQRPPEPQAPVRPAKSLEVASDSPPQGQPPTAPDTQRAWIQTPYAPPTTATEKTMAALWEELIGVEPVGIHDNYFTLGGHSLMATQILARIRDQYRVELSMRAFFETPTVAELAQRLDALQWLLQNQPAAGAPPVSGSEREEIAL